MTLTTPPGSSYRVQFNHSFTFADARALVDYFAALGVTHCYSSPYLKATAGSLHGYDICDHQEFNPEVGTEADFDAFTDALAAHRMGHILDFVPNHMGLDIEANEWWRDVLQNGPSSIFADYFDIDWEPVTRELKGKILLPILHDQYGAVLERGELQLEFDAGAVHLRYFNRRLPLDPQQAPRVFRSGLADAALPDDDPDVREYLSILAALENLPSSTERDAERSAGRRREQEVARDRLARLVGRSTIIRRQIEMAVEGFNGVVGAPSTFDALHALLDAQPYRLAHWRTAFDEINYRRFFDINELGGLRMENPRVFEAAHRLIVRLIGEHRISGLRLDHADGLFDPAAYFRRLQDAMRRVLSSAATAGTPGGPPYLLVEKILGVGEHLPEDWPVAGTTGYGFMNDVNGVFVDAEHAADLENIYARFTGLRQPFAEVAYHAKRLIMLNSMASELGVLAHALKRIAESDRHSRDFTLNALRRALVELVACFPVYRTYVSAAGFSATDREAIDLATDRARRRSPVMESSVFLFVRNVLLTGAELPIAGGTLNEAGIAERRAFAMKFQQYTAPVQAKGVEDTACYRYNVLLSLNEVGGDPRRFGRSVDEFHAGNRTRLERWPLEMITTATHDTKRGEDARARINVISEIPEEWRRAVASWMRLNAAHRTLVDRKPAPDRNDEYFYYQALLGAWPLEPAGSEIPREAHPELVQRLRDYMHKAIKEAKVHTSWLNENAAYEAAIARFVDATLAGPGAQRFLSAFVPFARRAAGVGAINSLAQLVLKLASPGVADFYQGTELWDYRLVDPDNRRPVDFAQRREMLATLSPWIDRSQRAWSASNRCATCSPEPLARYVASMLAEWHDGRIKMFLTACGLKLRESERDVVLHGEYVALTADDIGARHIVAFGRCFGQKILLAVVPRLTAGILAPGHPLPTGLRVWGSSSISLPPECAARTFRNVFTGEAVTPTTNGDRSSLVVADILNTCPVAMLWSEG